jgi:hypothetical protein
MHADNPDAPCPTILLDERQAAPANASTYSLFLGSLTAEAAAHARRGPGAWGQRVSIGCHVRSGPALC